MLLKDLCQNAENKVLHVSISSCGVGEDFLRCRMVSWASSLWRASLLAVCLFFHTHTHPHARSTLLYLHITRPKVQNGLAMVRDNKVLMHKFGFGMVEM